MVFIRTLRFRLCGTIVLLRVAMTLSMIALSLSAHALAQSEVQGKKVPNASPTAAAEVSGGETERLKVYALRLKPKQDLRKQLELFASARKIQAGLILTAVGSLQKVNLRLADKSDATPFEGKYEIVSLVGTLSPDGVHLHISVADSTGKTIGGHLVEGCEIYTTAEIVIADARGLVFARKQDAQTGYKELKILRAAPSNKRRR